MCGDCGVGRDALGAWLCPVYGGGPWLLGLGDNLGQPILRIESCFRDLNDSVLILNSFRFCLPNGFPMAKTTYSFEYILNLDEI